MEIKGLLTRDIITKFRDRVRGRDKITYLLILLADAEGYPNQDIAKAFNLTEGRISQIKSGNAELLADIVLDSKKLQQAERVLLAKKIIHKKGLSSKKDLLDWLEYLRKEIEGEKSLIELAIPTHIYLPARKSGKPQIKQTAELPKNRLV